ncbi:hypothetical protein [Thioalbus denitrificans]|uniref:hypothetical protein n=1 Tax=Thioalbus denitrificans TaxID=547122 RepID=UPI0011C073D4|nr:hypothetical protein [Thioalbus denitrificans]
MKHVEIETDGSCYRAAIRIESGPTEHVTFRTIESASKAEIEAVLMELGFHGRDILDAFALAEGRGVNTPHPFFEKALEIAKKSEK